MVSPDPAEKDKHLSHDNPMKKPIAYIFLLCLIFAIAPFYMKMMHLIWDYKLIELLPQFASWPVAVSLILLLFREQLRLLLEKLAEKVPNLQKAATPLGDFDFDRDQVEAVVKARESVIDILKLDFNQKEFTQPEYLECLSLFIFYLASFIEMSYTHPIGMTQLAALNESFQLLEKLLDKVKTSGVNLPALNLIETVQKRIVMIKEHNLHPFFLMPPYAPPPATQES